MNVDIKLAAPARPAAARPARRREAYQGYLLVLPIILLFAALVVYPFFNAIWLSMTDKVIGVEGKFVGLANYAWLLKWPDFERMFFNTWAIAIIGVTLKFVVGMVGALLLNVSFRGRVLMRGIFMLPWALPTFVATLTWRWLYDGRNGVFNNILMRTGLTDAPISFLGSPDFALWAIIILVVWKGFPFFTISYLAGMQGIPTEQYEAARVDGAGNWQQFFYITLPSLRHVIMITCLLSLIWTSNTFEMVYLLTGGGPSNRTQVFTVLAYHLGLQNMRIGEAAAVPMMFFPLLLGLIVIVSRYMLREEV
ncbi:MAG: sugar ABC transporter permease [Caldilineaceae bacterium]|nr:sugar ABC transporter permease [Caldilineaceae bacterium]